MSVHVPWFQDVLAVDTWLAGKTINALLVTDIYVDDPAITTRDGIVDEVTGTGYTTGGVTVTGVAAVDTATGVALTCDVVDFGASLTLDGWVGGIVFYVDTGDAATDQIVSADVFESERQIEAIGSPVTYTPAEEGFVVIGVSSA